MSGKFYSIERAVVEGAPNAKMLEYALHRILTAEAYPYVDAVIQSEDFKRDFRPIDSSYACIFDYNAVMRDLSHIESTDRHGEISIRDNMFASQAILEEVLRAYMVADEAYDEEGETFSCDFSTTMSKLDNSEVLQCHTEARSIYDNYASTDISSMDINPPLPLVVIKDLSSSTDAITGDLNKRRRELESNVEDRRNSLLDASQTVNERIREYAEANRELKRMTLSEEDYIEELKRNFLKSVESISNFEGLQVLSITKNRMYVATDMITITQVNEAAGLNYVVPLGHFLIVLGLNDYNIKVYPLAKSVVLQNGYFHPHVSTGFNVCLGNGANAISRASRIGDYATILNIIYTILITYNPDSPYVSIDHFDTEYKRLINDLQHKVKYIKAAVNTDSNRFALGGNTYFGNARDYIKLIQTRLYPDTILEPITSDVGLKNYLGYNAFKYKQGEISPNVYDSETEYSRVLPLDKSITVSNVDNPMDKLIDFMSYQISAIHRDLIKDADFESGALPDYCAIGFDVLPKWKEESTGGYHSRFHVLTVRISQNVLGDDSADSSQTVREFSRRYPLEEINKTQRLSINGGILVRMANNSSSACNYIDSESSLGRMEFYGYTGNHCGSRYGNVGDRTYLSLTEFNDPEKVDTYAKIVTNNYTSGNSNLFINFTMEVNVPYLEGARRVPYLLVSRSGSVGYPFLVNPSKINDWEQRFPKYNNNYLSKPFFYQSAGVVALDKGKTYMSDAFRKTAKALARVSGTMLNDRIRSAGYGDGSSTTNHSITLEKEFFISVPFYKETFENYWARVWTNLVYMQKYLALCYADEKRRTLNAQHAYLMANAIYSRYAEVWETTEARGRWADAVITLTDIYFTYDSLKSSDTHGALTLLAYTSPDVDLKIVDYPDAFIPMPSVASASEADKIESEDTTSSVVSDGGSPLPLSEYGSVEVFVDDSENIQF